MSGFGVGPIPARIMLVGEAWGAEEERANEPFVGVSGQELNRMLHEAGILRSECFVTNLINQRPPNNDLGQWIALKKKDITSQHVQLRDKWVLPLVKEGFRSLQAEILACQPNIIVAFGNAAMWALTGNWAITKWRGSQLELDLHALPSGWADVQSRPKVVPVIHPAAILREWSWRAATVNDLRRVKRHMTSRAYSKPEWNFRVQPSFAQVETVLNQLYWSIESHDEQVWIDFDLETRKGHISCVGVSWTKLDAICIPFMSSINKEGYWNAEQEAWIVWMLSRITTHPHVSVRWQNGLYDAQYTHRHWHFVPRGRQDTMISQHSLFSDLPKSLGFIASMYCDWFTYWKDEGKDFISGGRDEFKGWVYNCEDCIYTRESGEVLLQTADAMGLRAVHDAQQQMFYPVLKAMLRGVRVITDNRDRLAQEIQEQIDIRQSFLRTVLGCEININSNPQMHALFYQDLGQPVIMTRAKKGSPSHVTCDDEALQKIATREPLLKPVVNAIADIRTLGIFLGNFVLAQLDVDGRMRCSYNIGGSASGKSAPKTYRLSSSKNAFGGGANLMTIPSEKSKSVGKSKARGHIALIGDPYSLPNIRTMFGPDGGYTFFDMDLDRADLQVMAWDADDELLKAVCRLGVDVHLLNVYVLDQEEPPALEELVEGHPKYPDHRGPRKHKREFSKVFCHATDYLGKSRTVAAHTGRTVHEIDRAQKIYLARYKGIERWQLRIMEEVKKRRYVENKFGYRWYVFDRIDDQLMPEAVAWIPQSTTSIVINKAWYAIDQGLPEAQVLLQVHDSLAGQFPTHRKVHCLSELKRLAQVVVPYDDPLVIPVGISTSEVSWGDCA